MIRFIDQQTVRGEVDFVEPMLNLLAHAQAIELAIGSQCGGHGICGKDRIRVDESGRGQLSPLTEVEQNHLTEQEIRSGMRLACQTFPAPECRTLDVQIFI